MPVSIEWRWSQDEEHVEIRLVDPQLLSRLQTLSSTSLSAWQHEHVLITPLTVEVTYHSSTLTLDLCRPIQMRHARLAWASNLGSTANNSSNEQPQSSHLIGPDGSGDDEKRSATLDRVERPHLMLRLRKLSPDDDVTMWTMLVDSASRSHVPSIQLAFDSNEQTNALWPALVCEKSAHYSKADLLKRRQWSRDMAQKIEQDYYVSHREQISQQQVHERHSRWKQEETDQNLIHNIKAQERIVSEKELLKWTSSQQVQTSHSTGTSTAVADTGSHPYEHESKESVSNQIVPSSLSPRPPFQSPSSPTIGHMNSSNVIAVPPVRGSNRAVYVAFTPASNSQFASLPARETNNDTASHSQGLSVAANSSTMQALFADKDRADAQCRAGNLQAALDGYQSLLNSKDLLTVHTFAPLRCQVYSNLSATHSMMASRMASIPTIMARRNHARFAIDYCTQALNNSEHIKNAEKKIKLISRAALNCERLGEWNKALTFWQDTGSKHDIERVKDIILAVQNGVHEAHMDEARHQLIKKDYSSSLAALCSALSLAPQNIKYWENKAQVLIHLRDWSTQVLAATHGIALLEENSSQHDQVELLASFYLMRVHSRFFLRQFAGAHADMTRARVLQSPLMADAMWDKRLKRINQELLLFSAINEFQLLLHREQLPNASTHIEQALTLHAQMPRVAFCTCRDNHCDYCDKSQSEAARHWIDEHCKLLLEQCLVSIKLKSFVKAQRLVDLAAQMVDQFESNSEPDIQQTASSLRVRVHIELKRALCAAACGDAPKCRDILLKTAETFANVPDAVLHNQDMMKLNEYLIGTQ